MAGIVFGYVVHGLISVAVLFWFSLSVAAMALYSSKTVFYQLRPVFLCLTGICLYVVHADFRDESISHLDIREGFQKNLTGVVDEVDHRGGAGIRLKVTIGEPTPMTVLVLVRTGYPKDLIAGDVVVFDGVLQMPQGPVYPDGFDYRQFLQFEGVHYTGFATSDIIRIGVKESFKHSVEALRQSIANSFLGQMSEQGGPLAAALFVGKRDYILPEDRDHIRKAGLAHILAISGLHMGLVTGVLFLVAEIVLARITILTHHILPRKAAAILAWSGGLFYLIISGMSISTIRAFIMVSIVLFAVLVDRQALTIRNIGIAAFVILVIWPEALFSAGFQMSFAATIGLVLFFEQFTRQTKRDTEPQRKGRLHKLGKVFVLSLITTAVSQVAIGPIALYHFQEVATFGAAANLFVVPMMTMIVMPLGVLCLVLMPFGLMAPAAYVLDVVLLSILTIAQDFAQLDTFAVTVQSLPAWYGIVTYLGFLLICTVPRLVTAFFVLALWYAGILVAFETPKPIVMIGKTGHQVAVYREGEYKTYGLRSSGFVDDNWRQYWGIAPDQEAGRLVRQCGERGCIVDTGDFSVAFPEDIDFLRQACQAELVVVAPAQWQRYCQGSTLYVAIENLMTHGPLGVGIDEKSKDLFQVWSSPPAEK
ncbi:ComEC/Rec2 family competence protein [Kordiimonas sediminis]|nr:ComEC/Rec2 family competence protein [Kordiimonas sediminis]